MLSAKRGVASSDEGSSAAKSARGPALVEAKIDPDVQRAYAAREAQAGAALEAYAGRVDALREQLVLSEHPTRATACVLTLSDESLMTDPERDTSKRACVSDHKGRFAQALHRRSPRAVRLPDDKNELHLVTTGGRKVAVLVRDAVDPDLAARGQAALEQIHDAVSDGWMQGTEVCSHPPPPMVSPTRPPAPAARLAPHLPPWGT